MRECRYADTPKSWEGPSQREQGKSGPDRPDFVFSVTECFWDEKEWAVSTITKSFYHDGNAITGSQKTGEFSETNNYYKVVVPEKEYATYFSGEETITLNRNTLDLKHETYGFIFNYSCAIKDSQQI